MYTKEDGYIAYFELCKWQMDIDPNIQSAIATKNDLWAGIETVQSANVKRTVKLKKFSKNFFKRSILKFNHVDFNQFKAGFCG